MKHACLAAKVSFQLFPVNDGEKAIQYLGGEGTYNDRSAYPSPSLLFLDLKMPRKGGFEVLQWIREHPSWKGLPVLILTSSRHEVDIKRGYELGANSYLVKPVNFEALVNMARLVDLYWMHLIQKPPFDVRVLAGTTGA
jgi:DNA-binding response OmpR family regulator